MKKLFLLSLLFVSIVILLSIYIPKIEITINIEPNSESRVHGQEPNGSESSEIGCIIFHNYDLNEIGDDISALYPRGYRLKDFSVMPLQSGVITGYAAICKD